MKSRWKHVSTAGQHITACPECGGSVELVGTNYLYYRCQDCGEYSFFGIDFTDPCHEYSEPNYYTPLEIEERYPIPTKEIWAKPRNVMFNMIWETDGRISIYKRKRK